MIPTIDIDRALKRACIFVENEAKLKCPGGNTGILRRSITHEVNGNVGEVGTNMEYAPYVEYGTGLFAAAGDGRKDVPWRYQTADGEWHTTSGQSPQPFLVPALANNTDKIEEFILEEVIRNFKQ